MVGGRRYLIAYCRTPAEVVADVDLADLVEVTGRCMKTTLKEFMSRRLLAPTFRPSSRRVDVVRVDPGGLRSRRPLAPPFIEARCAAWTRLCPETSRRSWVPPFIEARSACPCRTWTPLQVAALLGAARIRDLGFSGRGVSRAPPSSRRDVAVGPVRRDGVAVRTLHPVLRAGLADLFTDKPGF
ncbi:hypothetical protein [Planotetraspora phitsanulokensis]|uniref:hypothetical protein n=1 Tax=Planotetraspora phitsanulokensis TaxID=575192 RepID=UPI00195297B6|nr:hypothetical protein [Planotetraspora phitsanulokensis]